MRLAIILAAFSTLGVAQTGRELTVPRSPAEVTLEETAKQIRDEQKVDSDALKQAQWELDHENGPILKKIEDLKAKIEENRQRIQKKFTDAHGKTQKNMLIDEYQIPFLVKEVKASSKLPDGATFDVDTGKWSVDK